MKVNIIAWGKNLRTEIAKKVQEVELAFDGKSGPEKREMIVTWADGMVKLPWWADELMDIDGKVIRLLVDKTCDAANILTDYNFKDIQIDPEKLGAAAAAPIDAVMKAAAANPVSENKQKTVDERLAELYEQYGIAPDPEPAPVEIPQQETIQAPVQQAPEPEQDPNRSITLVEVDAEKNWQKSIAFVGLAEGGKNFTVVNGQAVLNANAKNDKGGPTAYGITRMALATAYAGRVVGHCDITKLTKDEAVRIYKANYWSCYGWGELLYPTCLVLFDITVNSGLGGTAKISQRAANRMGWTPVLALDGKWGPKTKAAVWGLSLKLQFVKLLLEERKKFYDEIIARDSSQAVFKNGWYNRLKALAKEAGVTSPV
jgi:hypothetical protein